MAYASLKDEDITVHLAQEALVGILNAAARNVATVKSIRDVVATELNVPVDLLTSKTRRREIVRARQIAMFLAKELTNSTLKVIGEHFGGRDHTTVIHACQLVETQQRSNAAIAEQLKSLAARCRGKAVN